MPRLIQDYDNDFILELTERHYIDYDGEPLEPGRVHSALLGDRITWVDITEAEAAALHMWAVHTWPIGSWDDHTAKWRARCRPVWDKYHADPQPVR